MISGGALSNNDKTPGLEGGVNVLFDNPWTFLAPGNTAARPLPSTAIEYRLRLNTETQIYEYYDTLQVQWVQLSGTGTGTVNPGTANSIGYYAANGTIISPLSSMPNAIMITSGLSVPLFSTSLPAGISIPSATIIASTAALTSGQVVAAPVNPTDLANKAYVDSILAGTVLSITGTINQIVASSPTGNITLTMASNPIVPGTAGINLPVGTTAQRAGAAGSIRFNSTTSFFEGTSDGATWNSFLSGSGTVLSVTGTANEVEVDNTNPAAPIILLPAVLDIPGTMTIQGTTAVSAIINDDSMATASATNLATALSIKTYIDQVALSGTSVYAATTATLNAVQSGAGAGATLTDNSGTFAALSLDGIPIPLNSFILNKDQSTAANQGIYKLTTNGDGVSIPWVLTRSTTYDTPAEINSTGLITVRLGNTLAGTQWFNSATIVTVDTTAFSYSQFGVGFLSSTLANGKIFRGNVSNVAVASTAQYPDAAGTAGNVITSDGTNFVSSPNTGGASVSSVLFLMGG